MKLFDALNKLWDGFVEWLEDIGEDVLDALKPIARQIARSGGMALVTAAQAAVAAAESQGGSGEEKFKAAQKAVVASLEAQSIPIVINAINGAIEAAVAKLKDEAA